MVLQVFFRPNRPLSFKWGASLCLILLLISLLPMFNSTAASAQSAVIGAPGKLSTISVSSVGVQSSISSAQAATESMLSQSVATIGILRDEELLASDVFESLAPAVFIDINLEGVLDGDSNLKMKAGVSIFTSLKQALLKNDATIIVESDGSILVISIDDEYEPDYLRNITYDVTSIANSLDQAERLAMVVLNTVQSDSWELNGGGNGTVSLYQQNNRVLMTVNQSYGVHLGIRNHFQSVAALSGSRVINSQTTHTPRRLRSRSAPSSVVAVPVEQTKAALRSRRGFARPSSGTSGGMGGGGVF